MLGRTGIYFLTSLIGMILSFAVSFNCLAVPAAPIVRTPMQSDGSTSYPKQWGDEFSHGWANMTAALRIPQSLVPLQNNILLNGDFESGDMNWVPYSSGEYDLIDEDPLTENKYARLGGYNNAVEFIYQDVTLPSNATNVSVTFSYGILTDESTNPGPYDMMQVDIRRPVDNALLKTLLQVSNLDNSDYWQISDTYDISEFAGQTIRLIFQAQTNGAYPTDFFIDDIGVWVVVYPAETASTPSTPTGPISGNTGTIYSYSTGGSSSNLGHSIQYLFDWGDGTNSDWLTVGQTSASKSWPSVGAYAIKAKARCASDLIESNWSNPLNVTITTVGNLYTVTTNPAGLQVIVDASTHTAPQTFTWTPGTSHILSVSSSQSGTAGTQYTFFSWSDGGVQSHSITAPSSSNTYTANFTTQYLLTTSVNPPGAGTVNPFTGYHDSGQNVPISATPNGGYIFDHWSDDLSGTTNPATILMNSPMTVTADFVQIASQYALAVGINPPVSGSVVRNPDKPTYSSGEQVVLTATPNPGYSFSNWGGDTGGNTNPLILTMTGSKTVTANFNASAVVGPDLTGEWVSPYEICKTTSKGQKCKISGTFKARNIGNRDAATSTMSFYLSNDTQYDAGDTYLKSVSTGNLKAGESKFKKLKYNLRVGDSATGKYLIAVVDAYGSITEIDETNNIIIYGPMQ